MYINKFKCENPQLSTFKNGVAFCAGCAKNVYDANVVDLKSLLTESDSICGRVSTSKIAWMQRSIIGATFVATAMLTPIDAFAQEISEKNISIQETISIGVHYTGIVMESVLKEPLENVKVILYAGERLIGGVLTDEFGHFDLQVYEKDMKGEELNLELRGDNLYTNVRYSEIPATGLRDVQLVMEPKTATNHMETGVFIIGILEPVISVDPQPSGTTFKQSDLNHMMR